MIITHNQVGGTYSSRGLLVVFIHTETPDEKSPIWGGSTRMEINVKNKQNVKVLIYSGGLECWDL